MTLKQFYTGFSRLQRNPGDGYREFSAARSRAARNVAKYPATEPKSAIRIAEKKGKRDVPLCTFARFAMRATRKLRGEKVRKKRERERELPERSEPRDRTIIYLPVCQTSGTRRRVFNTKCRTTKSLMKRLATSEPELRARSCYFDEKPR